MGVGGSSCCFVLGTWLLFEPLFPLLLFFLLTMLLNRF